MGGALSKPRQKKAQRMPARGWMGVTTFSQHLSAPGIDPYTFQSAGLLSHILMPGTPKSSYGSSGRGPGMGILKSSQIILAISQDRAPQVCTYQLRFHRSASPRSSTPRLLSFPTSALLPTCSSSPSQRLTPLLGPEAHPLPSPGGPDFKGNDKSHKNNSS